MSRPTVGRIVHYRAMQGAEPAPAIVVRVYDHNVIDAVTFRRDADEPTAFLGRVSEGTGPAPFGWCWPPRAEP